LALEPGEPPVIHISYYDDEKGDLRHTSRLGDTGWLIKTVDSEGNVGRWNSLALGESGNPHISYYDTTRDNLKYAQRNGAIWRTETVDDESSVGKYTSMALDNVRNPYISYYDDTNNDLKFARFDGVVWIIQTVESVGSVGQFSSLALDPSGCPHISYYDATNGDLKYAHIPAMPVQAGFATSPTAGIAPLTVVFSNTSSGSYAESLWDFGDGAASRDETPVHTYEAPGRYLVTLTVMGPGGMDTALGPISVDYEVFLPIVLRDAVMGMR
jgi:hypothetical protein